MGKVNSTDCEPRAGRPSRRITRDDRGYNVNLRPDEGDRDMTFKIHLWAVAGFKCDYLIEEIVLEGPANAIIEGAFR